MAGPDRPLDVRLEDGVQSWPITDLVYAGLGVSSDGDICHRWVARVPDPVLHMMMMRGEIWLACGGLPARTAITVDFSPATS